MWTYHETFTLFQPAAPLNDGGILYSTKFFSSGWSKIVFWFVRSVLIVRTLLFLFLLSPSSFIGLNLCTVTRRGSVSWVFSLPWRLPGACRRSLLRFFRCRWSIWLVTRAIDYWMSAVWGDGMSMLLWNRNAAAIRSGYDCHHVPGWWCFWEVFGCCWKVRVKIYG